VRVTPLSADEFRLEGTIDRETDELLQEARELLGHAVPTGNLAQVIKHCLKATVTRLRQRKFGAGSQRQAGQAQQRPGPNGRHIPAAVRAEVWQRDGGTCTFVGDTGHRCDSTLRLEYDHVVPVARGGLSTVENLRLRCRAHNQYTAERELGKAVIAGKREAAKRRAVEERMRKQVERERTEARKAEIARQEQELGEAFRSLGYRGAELSRALAHCATRPDSPLEERLRHALRSMAPNARRESAIARAPA
jgi:5-methylcytosine-specific restriction endonuclease McrA